MASLDDIVKSHYILKKLKAFGLKLNFKQDNFFEIMRREDESSVCTFNKFCEVEAFIVGLEVAKELESN